MKTLFVPSSQFSLSIHLKNLFQQKNMAQLWDHLSVVGGKEEFPEENKVK